MNDEVEDHVCVFADTESNADFAVTLSEIMRCARIAEERFLIPPLDPADD